MMILVSILTILLLASLGATAMMFMQRKSMVNNRKKSDVRYETLSEKYTLLRKRVEEFFQEEGTGKIGMIEFNSSYANTARGYVEVEEVKKAGGMVKVRILDVSPMQGTTEEQLVKKVNEWMSEDRITWVDGWEMKKRGKTLEDILDDETKIDPEENKEK